MKKPLSRLKRLKKKSTENDHLKLLGFWVVGAFGFERQTPTMTVQKNEKARSDRYSIRNGKDGTKNSSTVSRLIRRSFFVLSSIRWATRMSVEKRTLESSISGDLLNILCGRKTRSALFAITCPMAPV